MRRRPANDPGIAPRLWTRVGAGIAMLLAFGALSTAASAAVHVYVSNQGSNSVSVFSIAADGSLSPVACDPTTSCLTGTHPFGVAVNPSGTHVYVVNSASSSVSVFSIGPDGALSPIPCDPTTSCKTGGGSAPIAIDPSGKHLYVANNLGSTGSVSVFSIDADGSLSPVTCDPNTSCKAGVNPFGIAVDPSGTHVYVTNGGDNSVGVYAIGPDGALSPVSCDPTTSCKTGGGPEGIVIDPAGRHVYVSNGGSPGSVSVFNVAGDGSLSPVTCDPTTSCAAGSDASAIAIDPAGAHVFTVSQSNGGVFAFQVGADGALSPIACATGCTTHSIAVAVGVDPAGSHLYVSNFVSNFVSVFGISSGGALSPVTCDKTTSCKTGSDPSLGSLAISPDQGPTAAFAATIAPAGSASSFDASGSSSPDYPVASYLWTFGDGQSATTTTASVQHAYARAGTYTATLTLSDQAGCSTQIVFTGQTASCNGSSKATAARTLTVPTAPAIAPQLVRISNLTMKPSAIVAAPRGPSIRPAARRRFGGLVSYSVTDAARTSFTVQRPAAGRRQGRACVKPTRRNRSHRRCTRWLKVRHGAFTLSSSTGTNRFRFMGRLNGRKLKTGKYRLRAVPRTAAGTGGAAVTRFRVKR